MVIKDENKDPVIQVSNEITDHLLVAACRIKDAVRLDPSLDCFSHGMGGKKEIPTLAVVVSGKKKVAALANFLISLDEKLPTDNA